jgi:multidrug efflux pump subunit AcrA (membrane-fusion protein)
VTLSSLSDEELRTLAYRLGLDDKRSISDIQPVETSVVRTIAVRMGQQVKAGEVLATLDPTFSLADRDELVAKLRNLSAIYDRLDAELAGRVYDPPNPNADEQTQRDVFRKRQAEYAAKLGAAERKTEQHKADLATHKSEVKGLQEQIRLASQAEDIYQQLVAKNLTSKLKLIDASQHLVDAKTRFDTNLGEQQKLSSRPPGRKPSATASCRNGSANCPRTSRRTAASATPRRRGCRRRKCATISR